MARVSIIIPAYNFGRYLGDALESVFAQTFRDWECVVADDGSIDDTAAVAERYAARDPRIRLLRLPHGGVAAARNAAIRATTGELVQFLDADDKLAPFKLEAHTRFLDELPETAIVYGNVAYFLSERPDRLLQSPYGHLSKSINDDQVHSAAAALQKFEHFNFMHIASALMRRVDLLKSGLFESSAWCSEDWDVWMSMAIAGCRFDHWGSLEPVAMIRTHATSASRHRGQVLRGLIGAAKAFPSRPASRHWQRDTLPLIYEVALGIDETEHGNARRGAQRIWRAARKATESLTAWRWRVYAVSALLLPRKAFFWFVSLPIPEQALATYRGVRRVFRR